MANTSALYVRIDTEVKEKAESILTQLGISPTSAIRMFYSQIVRENGLPLSLQLSSASPTVTDDTSPEEIDAEPTSGNDFIPSKKPVNKGFSPL